MTKRANCILIKVRCRYVDVKKFRYLCCMKKTLEDMTLEELWELFPITLVAYNPDWKVWAEEEMDLLTRLLSDYTVRISHIGSTAIPSIQSKPIIDLLVGLSDSFDWKAVKDLLKRNGYICMAESEGRMSFNKGYTIDGYAERVFHVHFHLPGDNDEIRFRDYLLEHSEVAKEYEKLKLSLLPKFRNDRDGYTAAKSEFVKRIAGLF